MHAAYHITSVTGAQSLIDTCTNFINNPFQSAWMAWIMLKTLKSYQHLVYLISIWFTRATCNNSVSFLSFNKCAIIHQKKKSMRSDWIRRYRHTWTGLSMSSCSRSPKNLSHSWMASSKILDGTGFLFFIRFLFCLNNLEAGSRLAENHS